MNGGRGKLIGLATLLGFWGLIVWSDSPSQEPLQVPARAAEGREQRGLSKNTDVFPRLKRDLLTAGHKPYVPAGVSLFSVPPPPPPPPPPVMAIAPDVPPAPPPPDPFMEAAKTLRFVGYLKSDAAMAAIIVQGTQLYIAARGEVVANSFRVVSVHEDTVTLASPEGEKQVRLAMATAAGVKAVPVATVTPSAGGGPSDDGTLAEVRADGEPATSKPAPFVAVKIPTRAERSEMYRTRARASQQ